MPYTSRTYRQCTRSPGLVSFTVTIGESDLFISAIRNLSDAARQAVREARDSISRYSARYPAFQSALEPLPDNPAAPSIIRDMLAAGRTAGVGPMAAVAGAVAAHTGQALLRLSPEVIVENGGDIWLKTSGPATVGIFAGDSILSGRVGIVLSPSGVPVSVCTSSGTVGPSLSFGHADAVCVIAASATLADAAATALGNRVSCIDDVSAALEHARALPGITGVVIIMNERLGVWGEIELTRL
jgi:uncharacterized protein